MASRGVASTGPLGLPKMVATNCDGVGTWGKCKFFHIFMEDPSESRASLYSPFQRPGNLECLYLQEFARVLWLGGGVGGETVMPMKFHFSSKEPDGRSLNMSLFMCQHEH